MANLIFDFGNVLVRWEPERVYTSHFGSEATAWWFLRHVANSQWRGRIDAGESTDTCINQLSSLYPDYKEAIHLYQSRWAEMLTGEMPGMRHLLEVALSAGHHLYGLTNWSMETFPQARERFGILQMIDHYVVSGAEGLIKPDPRLFRVLLNRYGLQAETCTFIDDNPDNVEAARALGMRGIVFTSAADLGHQLHLDL